MAGKKIEIQIVGTGGDQAAAELRKVEAATTGVSRGFGGMLDGTVPRIDEVIDKLEEMGKAVESAAVPISDHLGEIEEDMEGVSEGANQVDENVKKIARAQLAQGVSQLAGKFSEIGTRIRESADAVREFDPVLAETLQNSGRNIEQLSAAVSTLAIGFAVGGPLGAGIAAITLQLGEAMNAWQEMTVAIAAADAAQQRATEMASQLAAMEYYGAEAYNAAATAAENLTRITEQSTEAIDKQISALTRRNAIQNADDSAYGAKRDREDAAAIRGGAAPEDVKAKRAQDDAGIAQRRLDREEEIKTTGIRDASNAVIKAEGELGAIKVSRNSSPEAIAAAEKKVDELKQRLEKMQAEAEDFTRIAGARRREITERTTGTVEGLQDSKQSRLAREAAQKKTADERAAAAAEKARDSQQTGFDRDAAGIGRDAKGIVPKGARREGREAIERVAARLKDGDQGGELKELIGLLNSLLNSTASKDASNKADIQALKARAANLEGQVKASRTGK